MSQTPRFCIVIAVFNGSATLQRALDSIRTQPVDAEVIVIDGGSKDGTVGILRRNQEHLAKWISEPDKGIYDAWNKALPFIRAEWTLFLGCDDVLVGGALLEAQARLSALEPRTEVAYGRVRLVDEAGQVLGSSGQSWEKERRRFGQGLMRLPHSAMFHRKSLFDRGLRYDPRYKIAGDYAFLLQALQEADPVYLDGLVVTDMQVGGISSNLRNRLRTLRESKEARKSQGGAGIPWRWYPVYLYNAAVVFTDAAKRRLADVIQRRPDDD